MSKPIKALPRKRLPERRCHAAHLPEHISFERLTIWLFGSGDAPSEKYLRVDYDPNDQMASGLPAALLALGLVSPSFIAPGDIVRVDHDLAHASVSVRFQPSDTPSFQDI
jgi:hypothetical protein